MSFSLLDVLNNQLEGLNAVLSFSFTLKKKAMKTEREY